MIGKLLLTLLVVLGAYGVLRARWHRDRVARGLEPARPPLVPRGAIRLAAAIVVAAMALGSVLGLLQGWRQEREVVQVQVVNANTGQLTTYRVRRGSIQGRRLVTLDGRQIRLADVERMIILPPDSADQPGFPPRSAGP
ncbi:hypothetical protein [Thiocystis violacea]|uniref:hypothetical protein n=1 Tax=Thiocystis violacea TaxID=13725 RepID=UPI0019073434|nr:hypothetical protein [Thiocystis violacea]MBK1721062.1 hypothetical protein [Thiocystis violacea]